jgi:gliding motility-associated-like protein
MKRCVLILFTFIPIVCFSQDIEVFQQFYGRYSYTAIGSTLNPAENNLARWFCEPLTESSAALNLNANQNIIAAYIYWAGSGEGDTEVTLNGTDISADETLLVDYEDPFQGTLTYFSCFKEITSFIQDNGNVNYTLSNLDISNVLSSNPGYCRNRTNFAGWSIFVVYEEEILPLNQVSIYHGLEIINRNEQEINITIENLNVLDDDGAKIGFLAWEGDNSLNYGESLVFNGSVLENLPLNPGDNAFNGTNTFSNSTSSYNMDLDVYDIENFINIGDNSATIKLTTGAEISGQIRADLIIINNIVTVLNSQLPDATTQINEIVSSCDNRTIEVNYTVSNLNSTEFLPAETPISFYADGVLVASSFTQNDILIGENEIGILNIVLPNNMSSTFSLTVVADDLGTGVGIVNETNETNNTSNVQVDLLVKPILIALPDIESCDEGFNSAFFDLTINENLLDLETNTINYYITNEDAINQQNEITDSENYKNVEDLETVYVRIDNDFCYQIVSFNLIILNCPPFIPTGFSPNNDGVNDEFNIQGLLTIFENFELQIFNRYGTLIYQGGDELGFWDAKANKGINNIGELLPVGTYYYVLNLNDLNYKKPLTGWVYINY